MFARHGAQGENADWRRNRIVVRAEFPLPQYPSSYSGVVTLLRSFVGHLMRNGTRDVGGEVDAENKWVLPYAALPVAQIEGELPGGAAAQVETDRDRLYRNGE